MKQNKTITVSEQLRTAVEAGPITRYEISKRTGLDESLLSKFVHGQTGLSFRSIDILCGCLGLELRPVKPKRPAVKAAKRPAKRRTSTKRPTSKRKGG